MHSGGDKDIDYLIDAILKGSKEAGMSMDEIRAKRMLSTTLRQHPVRTRFRC
jgi:hypothetical protein